MTEPKIYVGPKIDTNANYDVFIFVPDISKEDKDGLVAKARLKYIELYERDNLREKRQNIGVIPQLSNSQRPKRKRITR